MKVVQMTVVNTLEIISSLDDTIATYGHLKDTISNEDEYHVYFLMLENKLENLHLIRLDLLKQLGA